MVLAAMANPPEHDFAPSWLKVPADQQKRGQNLGSHQDSEGANKSRHRHYSSTDSSGTPSSYGRPQTAGHPGSYANRGRETDRRHYPRPGTDSRHHSVDDLNGYVDYGSWSLPQYNGYYPSPSNYPRRGGSVGPRDGHYGSSHYGDVFHPGNVGRGQYNGGGGRGRQRYNSGSRADKDNHQDSGSSSTIGVDSKKINGKEEQPKSSALFSNDFPSLIGDNSKTNTKAAAKTGNTPAGVWGKSPGAAKVQISGRKVQLIKKVIHNDLPPRDPNLTSRDPNTSTTKSSKIATSPTDTERSKFVSHGGSGSRGDRTASSGSTTPSSGGNSLLKTSPVPQKTSTNDKVTNPSSPTTPSKNSHPSPNSPRDPQPTNYTHNKQNDNKTVDDYYTPKETSRFVSAKNGVNKPPQEGALSTTTKDISKAGPGKQFIDIGAKVASKPVSMTTTQQIAVPRNYKPVSVSTTTKPAIRKESPTKPVLVQATKPVLVNISKPVLVQTTKPVLVQTPNPVLIQTPKPVLVQTSKPGLVNNTKPVLVQATTPASNTKPTIKSMSVKNSGKESPTKPILVQTSSTKPTIKSMSSKDSPIRSVPIQIKSSNSAKFSGKDAPIRQFPMRSSNSKQGGRVVVRPGPVQIRSNRLVAKESPTGRPVQALNRKHETDYSISNIKSGSQPPVSSYSSSAKEPSSNPRTPPMDIRTSTFSLNKNVNNSDRLKGALTGLQNGGDYWSGNGPLRIEDAQRMNGPQHSTSTTEVNTLTGDIKQHNGLDNDLHSGRNHLALSSSLEAEKRLLQEMGWHEHSDNEEVYAPITEDEMKEFQRRSQQLKKNGVTRSLPVTSLSSSLPSTQMTSIDLDDALSSCSSDSSDDDL